MSMVTGPSRPSALVLPAGSVWRTCDIVGVVDPAPSSKLVPVPGSGGATVGGVFPGGSGVRGRFTSTVPSLVTPSPGVPVSFSSAAVGAAGMPVSMVIGPSWPGALVLPASSVWRTWTSPASCSPGGNSKLVPAPGSQVWPPSVEYSQVASGSMPLTRMVPSMVMPSPGVPVSFSSVSTGAAGGLEVSTITGPRRPEVLVLPASSVWRTCTSSASYSPGSSSKLVPVLGVPGLAAIGRILPTCALLQATDIDRRVAGTAVTLFPGIVRERGGGGRGRSGIVLVGRVGIVVTVLASQRDGPGEAKSAEAEQDGQRAIVVVVVVQERLDIADLQEIERVAAGRLVPVPQASVRSLQHQFAAGAVRGPGVETGDGDGLTRDQIDHEILPAALQVVDVGRLEESGRLCRGRRERSGRQAPDAARRWRDR